MLTELPERIPQGVETYVLTLLASLLIAMLTVSYRSFSAAIQNPVESLRQNDHTHTPTHTRLTIND
jgi:hypothetical protein